MRARTLFLLLISAVVCTSFSYASAPAKRKSATSAASRKAKSKKKKKVSPLRLRRIHQAFVASTQLRPMARQLLETRSRAAYAGVEAFARKHARDDAGTLANLALGYAHVLDHDPAQAIPPLTAAHARANELAEYTTYLLGSSYQATGNSARASETLRDFQSRYPDSIFAGDAAVVYGNALVNSGHAAEAAAMLQKYRLPTRSDLEFALGRAQLKSGDATGGADTLRHLYFSMPLAGESDDAGALLRSTVGSTGETFALQKTRADLLAQARRFRDAAREYRELLALASPQDRPAVQVAMAGALHRAGDDRQARDVLEHLSVPPGELDGERLFYLAEMVRNTDEDRFLALVQQIRQTAPNSSWLEQALLSAGNLFLLHNDYDRAIDFFRELHQRFPKGKQAPYAHWRVAWLSLRQGRNDEARRLLEEQVALYPASPQVPAAMYWRARLAEEDHDPLRARAYYQKLAERFRNYYYAELARDRMKQLHIAAPVAADPVLDAIPPMRPYTEFGNVDVPADNLRVQKARLLENGGLTDFAIRELRAAAAEEGGAGWATAEMARIYRDDGQYHRALEVLKRALPGYFALDIPGLPRCYWESLFPRPWWTELERFSGSNELDPYLVASLIRQESEFNPAAVSNANAVGLMQLLPSTGRKVARELRVPRYSTQSLLTPTVNLQLGTRYFRDMLNHFNGRVEYALAAYNAGSDRVETWLANGKYRDPVEFVESIPFTETREYVQAILRNTMVYKRLYGRSE